uniref:Uncharacterized protein n=1 Tax=Anguilla anguilla TaxID=7936 RepID=A0A0E9S790_ANGAN
MKGRFVDGRFFLSFRFLSGRMIPR